ncbi:MAG: hypothetical protein ACT4OI_03795 [Methanobacteriota archaeon]
MEHAKRNALAAPSAALAALLVVLAVIIQLPTSQGLSGASVRLWSDPQGDVTLSNADLLAGGAFVVGRTVDLRVRFLSEPFPTTATHHVSWCLDMDDDSTTGDACGPFPGADWGFTLFGGLGALTPCSFSVNADLQGVDVRPYLWYDPLTRTLRLRLPLALFGNDGSFRYIVESAFGGSFGVNDRAPQVASFATTGGAFASVRGNAPFSGSLVCAG